MDAEDCSRNGWGRRTSIDRAVTLKDSAEQTIGGHRFQQAAHVGAWSLEERMSRGGHQVMRKMHIEKKVASHAYKQEVHNNFDIFVRFFGRSDQVCG